MTTADADERAGWRERAAAWVDGTQDPVVLPAELLHDVLQHAREAYPEEACGLLLGPPDGPLFEVVRCTNVQTRRKLAGQSELDARDGYWIDEQQLLRTQQRADREGLEIRIVYHSHCDAGAYFSHADRDGALGPTGEPLYPGVTQLVLAVYESGVRDLAAYTWCARDGRFVGHAVEPAA